MFFSGGGVGAENDGGGMNAEAGVCWMDEEGWYDGGWYDGFKFEL